jgi:hypothetical protein
MLPHLRQVPAKRLKGFGRLFSLGRKSGDAETKCGQETNGQGYKQNEWQLESSKHGRLPPAL